MCIQKGVKTLFLLAIIVFFVNCEAMDSIIPSAGTYKLNMQINDTPLDERSFFTSISNIRPFFEESVANDQDVTALMVFLRNSSGEIVGDRVIYNLEQGGNLEEYAHEIIIPVQNLDSALPYLPVPEDLPMGIYTIVSQVMSGRNILQRTERSFFYLSGADFSFEGINVYLPGIAESSRIIPRGAVVKLEARLDSDSSFDPYIVWYNGRRVISEGTFSSGAGQLFWRVPEQSGFYSLRAEVFPVKINERLAGYQREISLLVSNQAMSVHLVSENIPQLIHWYVFEGNLNDSKMTASGDRALTHTTGAPRWVGRDRTYGLVTGKNNIVSLPNVFVPNDEIKIWQTKFRFLPVNDGGVFSVFFDASRNVSMNLFIEGQNLVLTLSSPLETVSQTFSLSGAFSELSEDSQTARQNGFLTKGIIFLIKPDLLKAQVNIMDGPFDHEVPAQPIALEVNINMDNEFQVFLGHLPGNPEVHTGPEFNVLWDEFALYYMPPTEFLTEEIKLLAGVN